MNHWWAVSLPHHKVKINKYYVSVADHLPPLQWVLQAHNESGHWVNISTISKSELDYNTTKEYEITNPIGYYSSFRILSEKLQFSGNLYHYCIFKFDFQGVLKRKYFGTSMRYYIHPERLIFIIFLCL